MINGPIEFSPLINAIKGDIENRCHQFTSITYSEEGIRYKNNLCKYHYYLKYIANNKVYNIYEMKKKVE